jgi:hypothetical protein
MGPVLSWHGPSYSGSHFEVKKEWTHRIVGPNVGPTFFRDMVEWVLLFVGPMFCGTRFDWVIL